MEEYQNNDPLNNKKNSKTFEEHIVSTTTRTVPLYKTSHLIKKKMLIIIEVILVIISFIFFIKLQNLGVLIIFLILEICMWKIGRKRRKKLYKYPKKKNEEQEQEVEQAIPSYFPNTRYDQTYVPTYGIPTQKKPEEIKKYKKFQTKIVSKMKWPINIKKHKVDVYKNFRKAAEYNTNWLDAESQTIRLNPDEKVILHHWTPLKISKKTSFWDGLKQFIMLIIYFGIYGLISFLVTDKGSGHFDATMQALFFPVFPYILICYRNISKYIKALLLSFFLMVAVFTPLARNGFITEEGIPFLKYFLFIYTYFPNLMHFIYKSSNVDNVLEFTNNLLTIIFIFEFIILIFNSIFKKQSYISVVLSDKAIYVRSKTKKSIKDILVNILWILMNPFNISQYKEMQDRIRYNKMTSKEGKTHDFSKISPDSIQKLSIKKRSVKFRLFLSLGFIIIGIFSFVSILGIPFMGIGTILLISGIRKRGKYSIYLKVNRKEVEGSWILSHKYDIFDLKDISEPIAKKFAIF